MSARLIMVAVALSAALLAACGEQVPSDPVVVQNPLCMSDFQACVMPVLQGQIRRRGGAVVSCMDGNCHAVGGNGGRFTLSSDVNANFLAVSSMANRNDINQSLVLVEPTLDSAAPSAAAGFHGGGDLFPSSSDNCYTVIHNWLSIDENNASCGQCTSNPQTATTIANTFTQCGY